VETATSGSREEEIFGLPPFRPRLDDRPDPIRRGTSRDQLLFVVDLSMTARALPVCGTERFRTVPGYGTLRGRGL
jgi:hypothetical protein